MARVRVALCQLDTVVGDIDGNAERILTGMSRADAEGLGQRIRDSLARSKSRLVLDLKKLQWDKVDDLRPLREKLSAYRSRIRLVLPKVASAHPEVILLAGMFQHYNG